MLATSITRAQTMLNLRSSLNQRRQSSAGAVPDVIHRRPFRVVAGVDWSPRRILAIIQQAEDVIALQRWLRTFPFKETSDLTVLCLMSRPQRGEPIGPLSAQFWKDAAMNYARRLLDPMVRDLDGPLLRVTGRAVWGHPPTIILQEASNFDLLMLHGSDRTDRYTSRSGLPWRALLRLAPCSTLVVRNL